MTLSTTSRVPESGRGRAPGPSVASPSDWLVQILSDMPAEGHGSLLYLGMHVRGSVTTVRDRAEIPLEPNDLVFCDPARRHLLRFGEGCQMLFFRIPRSYLGVTEAEMDKVVGVPVPGSEGLGALVSDFLSALADKAEFRRSTVGDRLGRTALHLLSVLVMELLEMETTDEAADASRAGSALLSRIRTYVEENLMDPDLSPEMIARAHHISVRYLHKLFQNDGTTVSQWVRRRRLEACRVELGRSNRRFTVAAVANRWGFGSPSHFSRTFRGAYGMSPSEWQSLATSAFPPAAPAPAAGARGPRPADGVLASTPA